MYLIYINDVYTHITKLILYYKTKTFFNLLLGIYSEGGAQTYYLSELLRTLTVSVVVTVLL